MESEEKYVILYEFEKRLLHQEARKPRLLTIQKAFKEVNGYENWEPSLYPFLFHFLYSYTLTLHTEKNPNVDTSPLEKEVEDLYRAIVSSDKFTHCKNAYMKEYQKYNEKSLWNLYEKTIYLAHMKVQKSTKSRKYHHEFCTKSMENYYQFAFLMDILPITKENAYMFGNMALFFKQNLISSCEAYKNVASFLEEEVRPYVIRK